MASRSSLYKANEDDICYRFHSNLYTGASAHGTARKRIVTNKNLLSSHRRNKIRFIKNESHSIKFALKLTYGRNRYSLLDSCYKKIINYIKLLNELICMWCDVNFFYHHQHVWGCNVDSSWRHPASESRPRPLGWGSGCRRGVCHWTRPAPRTTYPTPKYDSIMRLDDLTIPTYSQFIIYPNNRPIVWYMYITSIFKKNKINFSKQICEQIFRYNGRSLHMFKLNCFQLKTDVQLFYYFWIRWNGLNL